MITTATPNTTATTAANAATTAQSADASPAAASPTPAAPGVATPGAAPAAALPDAAQPFARWLGQQADALALDAPLPVAGQAVANDAPAAGDSKAPAGAKTDDAVPADAAAPAPAQDTTMLAAMALPLMPLSPNQAAQALQAMLPAQGAGGKKDDARAPVGAATAAGRPAATTATLLSMLPAAGAPSAARAQTAPADAQLAADLPADASGTGDRTAALSLAAMPREQGAAAAMPVNVQGAADGQDDAAGRTQAASVQNNAAPTAAAGDVAALAAAPAQNAPAADTVRLAGPATAWRQSLQEALGDKMHVQVTNNVEQAVIRLEPPQLGRIDIAIRHSAGTLEVNITASNGEVLRQLQTVSDNLRSDLSQRQFTEVAVTVAPAPRQGNTSPFGEPQQQGRGRQQARDEENEPGRALAEADTARSRFTLAGRE